MRVGSSRHPYLADMLWTGMSEIYLLGVLYGWWLNPSDAVHAGYGLDGSIAVLAFSALLVVVGAAVILGASRVPRPARLTVAWLMIVIAGLGPGTLAIGDLFTSGTGYLLAGAVVGMVVLAATLIQAPRKGRS